MLSQEQRQEAARLLAEHRAFMKGVRGASSVASSVANAFVPGLGIFLSIQSYIARGAIWHTYEKDLEAIVRGERDEPRW